MAYDHGRAERREKIMKSVPRECKNLRFDLNKNHRRKVTSDKDNEYSNDVIDLQSKHNKGLPSFLPHYVVAHSSVEPSKVDKTTYCRPVKNLEKKHAIDESIEKQQKLLKITEMLAEARRKEKHKDAWDLYILALKMKHNVLKCESQPLTYKMMEKSLLPEQLYDDFYNNILKENPSNICKHPLQNNSYREFHHNTNPQSLSRDKYENHNQVQLPTVESEEHVSLNFKSNFCYSVISKERFQKKIACNSWDLRNPNRKTNCLETLYKHQIIFGESTCSDSKADFQTGTSEACATAACSLRPNPCYVCYQKKCLSSEYELRDSIQSNRSLPNSQSDQVKNVDYNIKRTDYTTLILQSEMQINSSTGNQVMTELESEEKILNASENTPKSKSLKMTRVATFVKLQPKSIKKCRQNDEGINNYKRKRTNIRTLQLKSDPESSDSTELCETENKSNKAMGYCNKSSKLQGTIQRQMSVGKPDTSSDTTELESEEMVQARRLPRKSLQVPLPPLVEKIKPRHKGKNSQDVVTKTKRTDKGQIQTQESAQKLESSDESQERIQYKPIKKQRESMIPKPRPVENTQQIYYEPLHLEKEMQTQESARKLESLDDKYNKKVGQDKEIDSNKLTTCNEYTRAEKGGQTQMQESTQTLELSATTNKTLDPKHQPCVNGIVQERTCNNFTSNIGCEDKVNDNVRLSKEERQDAENKLLCFKCRIRTLLGVAYGDLVDKTETHKECSHREMKEDEDDITKCCRIYKSLQRILQASLKDLTDSEMQYINKKYIQNKHEKLGQKEYFKCECRSTETFQPDSADMPFIAYKALNTTQCFGKDIIGENNVKGSVENKFNNYCSYQVHTNNLYRNKHLITKGTNTLKHCVENHAEKNNYMQINKGSDDVDRKSVRTLLCEVEQTADNIVNMQEVCKEELDQSKKAKIHIDEILGEGPSYEQRHEVKQYDHISLVGFSTNDCCTEVTTSLTKVNHNVFPKNKLINENVLTVAVNTEPLGFLALYALSKEAVGRLLSYARVTCNNFIPIPLSLTPRLPLLSFRLMNRNIGAVPQLASIENWRRQQTDQHNSIECILPTSRDCCICKQLEERQNKRPVIFPCRYCSKGFIRAYCRELHEQTCAKKQGKKHDVPINLALLR